MFWIPRLPTVSPTVMPGLIRGVSTCICSRISAAISSTRGRAKVCRIRAILGNGHRVSVIGASLLWGRTPHWGRKRLPAGCRFSGVSPMGEGAAPYIEKQIKIVYYTEISTTSSQWRTVTPEGAAEASCSVQPLHPVMIWRQSAKPSTHRRPMAADTSASVILRMPPSRSTVPYLS